MVVGIGMLQNYTKLDMQELDLKEKQSKQVEHLGWFIKEKCSEVEKLKQWLIFNSYTIP